MMQPTLKAAKPMYGLHLLRIESNHIVKCADGVKRQYKVRDLDRHAGCKRSVVCLKCGKSYATREDMIAEHPEHKVLVSNEEIHAWAYWSEDAFPAVKDAEKGDKNAPKTVDYSRILGLLSDGSRMRD